MGKSIEVGMIVKVRGMSGQQVITDTCRDGIFLSAGILKRDGSSITVSAIGSAEDSLIMETGDIVNSEIIEKALIEAFRARNGFKPDADYINSIHNGIMSKPRRINLP